MAHNFGHFQILGLDILLDSDLKAWLLEVNNYSSLSTDSPLDSKIKFDMLYEAMALMNFHKKYESAGSREGQISDADTELDSLRQILEME